MSTPRNIRETLGALIDRPSLALARQLEQELATAGYRKMVFGCRVNQKASIEAASESDQGAVERLANAFDASLTAARKISRTGPSDSSLTPRKAVQRFLKGLLQSISSTEEKIRVKESIVRDIVLDCYQHCFRLEDMPEGVHEQVFTDPDDAKRAAEICLNFDKALRILEREKSTKIRAPA